MKVFEDRSTYDRKADGVATLTLTVECSPGQVANLSNFLVGISAKAGVYSVEMDHVVSVQKIEESDVERPLQREIQRPGTDDGDGREATFTGQAGHVDAGTDGELAGASGEVGAEPIGGSS